VLNQIHGNTSDRSAGGADYKTTPNTIAHFNFPIRHNAEAQLSPERPEAAEGTRSAAALRAVNCSELLALPEHL